GDAPAPNSLWQRRSRDGGRTWDGPTVIREGLESDVPGEKLGYSDPSYVVDRETGLIFCFHVFSKDAGVWDSAYGTDDEDRDVLSAAVSVSEDSGRTWSARSVTEVVTPGNCRRAFATSGAGIQLRYGSCRRRRASVPATLRQFSRAARPAVARVRLRCGQRGRRGDRAGLLGVLRGPWPVLADGSTGREGQGRDQGRPALRRHADDEFP